jgi:hypothetical protein
VCVCVCVCTRGIEREGGRRRAARAPRRRQRRRPPRPSARCHLSTAVEVVVLAGARVGCTVTSPTRVLDRPSRGPFTITCNTNQIKSTRKATVAFHQGQIPVAQVYPWLPHSQRLLAKTPANIQRKLRRVPAAVGVAMVDTLDCWPLQRLVLRLHSCSGVPRT